MTDVLIVSDLWQPFPGGAERLIYNIGRWLYQDGLDVRALTGYELACQLDGPPVEIFDKFYVGDRVHEGAGHLHRFLATMRPRLIITHHLYARQYAHIFQFWADRGVPIVQIVLNGPRWNFATFAAHITDHVRQHAGAYPGDMVLLPPAFPDVRADTHEMAVGFIKPIPHKGVELVYQLAAALPERPFVILRGEWQDLEVIRPAPNIEFMEPVVDMRDFYARVDVMVMPSRKEDAGTVAQEATVNGIPCISSNVDGLPETNPGGILLAPDDLPGWVAAVRSLDDPVRYAEVVARMQDVAPDWDAQMGAFTGRITGLLDAGTVK